MNRQELQAKLGTVTTKLFREKGYVAFVDVFMELGYLDPEQAKPFDENCRVGS